MRLAEAVAHKVECVLIRVVVRGRRDRRRVRFLRQALKSVVAPGLRHGRVSAVGLELLLRHRCSKTVCLERVDVARQKRRASFVGDTRQSAKRVVNIVGLRAVRVGHVIDVSDGCVEVVRDQRRPQSCPILLGDGHGLQALQRVRSVRDVRVGRVRPRVEAGRRIEDIIHGPLGRCDRVDPALRIKTVLRDPLCRVDGVGYLVLASESIEVINNRLARRLQAGRVKGLRVVAPERIVVEYFLLALEVRVRCLTAVGIVRRAFHLAHR